MHPVLRTSVLFLLVTAVGCGTSRRRGSDDEADASDSTDSLDGSDATDATDSPDGSDVTDSPDGSDVTDSPDGSDVTDSPDGSDVTDSPDGSDVTDSPDGSDVTDSPDGSDVTDSSDGSDAIDSVDGTDATDSPDGLDTTDATDGSDATDSQDVSDAADSTDGSDGTDGTGATWDTVIPCTPLPAVPAPAQGCVVEPGVAGLLISGDILAPDGVYTGGSVLVGADGRIACVGCDCGAQAGAATRVTCSDAVVSPGLINAHEHIGWMNDRPWVATEQSPPVDPALRWEHRHDWRNGKRSQPEIEHGPGGASTDDKTFGELRFALGGATATFGSGDTAGILRDLDDTGSGDNGLAHPGAEYNTFPLGDSGGKQLADGCDYADPSKMVTQAPSGTFVPHVSEGIDDEARNEFLCLTGQGQGWSVLTDAAAIIHGVGLSASDVALMAQKGIGLVWSPRTNVSLYGDTARVTLMARQGVTIGLGSDWLASGSMNMLRELACADYLNEHHFDGYFSDGDLWAMATSGAAAALGYDDVIGHLATGYVADVAIFAKNGKQAHRAVLAADVGATLLVLRAGEPVVGNDAIMQALEPGCDSLGDVCGVSKRACVSRDVGKTWANVLSAIGSPNYPLFFCGVPDDEPTCVPARTLASDAVSGSNLYGMTSADDPDGDGIETGADLCPAIFDPIRPVDAGEQADADGDLQGDVCDPCPLDAGVTTCTQFDPNDPDKDGVTTSADNCPKVANPDQTDGDQDDKGNACDDCPGHPNPGSAACPADIVQVKTLAALLGKVVALEGFVVTAIAGNGFFAQKQGAPPVAHSGVFAYTGALPTLVPGDGIDVTSATVADFFGQVQLQDLTFLKTATSQLVTPQLLSSNEIASVVAQGQKAGYEGMLVTVVDVTVTDAAPPPGSGDTTGANEFEVTGGLRVDDAIWPAATPLYDKPAAGASFGGLTGVLAWRNGYLKLLLRGPGDIAYGETALKALEPTTGTFQRAGQAGPTSPTALRVVLTHASTDPVQVLVESGQPSIAEPVGQYVVVPAGAVSAVVPIEGFAPGVATIFASYDGEVFSAEVTILAANAQPKVVAIDPAEATIVVGATQTFTVSLDIPANAGGTTLSISGGGNVGNAPMSVSVPAGQVTAEFDFQAEDPGWSSLFVSGGGGSVEATIEVVEVSSASIDLSGWKIVQASSTATFTLPAGTVLSGGGYLILARDADRATFEAHWGVTLGSDVVFLDSNDKLPLVNGDETYTLVDASGATIDGPTVPMVTSKAVFARKVPVEAAGSATAWVNGEATPGSGQATSSSGNGVYISEFADSAGTGAFVYEYVELHFDGVKP